MKIYFKPEGGIGFFPGLNKPLELNSEKLPEEEANHLKQLVNEASFFNLSNDASKPAAGADRKKYTIKIEDEDREHRVELSDTEQDPCLQNLFNYLQKKLKENRSK